MITLEQTIARMKAEILSDMAAGRVPKTVATFGALHDYVDANEYGGFCEDEMFDALIEQFGGRDEHEGMPQGMLDFFNSSQDTIDTWLRAGMPTQQA